MIQPWTKSKFRAGFYLNREDRDYIEKTGIGQIEKHAYEFISRRLAPEKPYKDGKQTPYSGHPVFKAQHATATCCRTCLMKWHKIPKYKKLTNEEINYAVEIIIKWIKKEKIKIMALVLPGKPQ